MTIKEVAENLDIPLGTAKTVLYRALKRLLRGNMKKTPPNSLIVTEDGGLKVPAIELPEDTVDADMIIIV